MKQSSGRARGLAIAAICAGCHCAPSVVPKEAGVAPPRCDYLSPAASRLTDPDPGAAQQQAVISATLLARSPEPTSENILTAKELFMVMIKQDPRQPEEAVYILQTPPRPTPGEYTVVHARAEGLLLFKSTGAGAKFTEAAIDAEAVHALERAWGPMTLEARWPDREGKINRMKWGGTTYTFDYRGDNVYGQGDAVSPDGGTCAASLVGLSELLARFADEPNEKKRNFLRTELVRQSKALSARVSG